MAATIEPAVREFIARQHVFFVATAPLAKDGHINVSPKGLDSLRVLDERTVAYVDLTGSGAETIAHLRENGRITVMFCAFEGDPKIVRVYGRGEAIEPDHPEFGVLLKHFRNWPGLRAIIRIHVERVAQSCGYGVPLYQFVGDRSRLIDWAQQKGPQGLRDYQQRHNRWSIDGLPGLRMAAGSTRGDDSSTTSSSSS